MHAGIRLWTNKGKKRKVQVTMHEDHIYGNAGFCGGDNGGPVKSGA